MSADDGIWQRFSEGSAHLLDVLLRESTTGTILDSLARIVGETLGVDRSLIFDVSLPHDEGRAITEWLNPHHPEVKATRGNYPLALFRASTRYALETHGMIESHASAPHPMLVEEGSVPLVHGDMAIKSLVWYPFAFRKDGFYLLAFNHVVAPHKWTDAELEFVRSAARHVEMALVKKELEEGVRRSLREKEILLHEIHHRVRNNLQLIISLLHLKVGLASDDLTRSALIESENRVHSIALAHDLLYESQDFSSIDLGEYLQAVVRQVRYSYGGDTPSVEAIVMAHDVRLDIELVVSCGLIVTELVTNALRHAFPDGRNGHVWISVTPRDHEIVLDVHDDGIGMDCQPASGLGLHLVRTLAQRLGGTMEVDCSQGTRVRVVFPSRAPLEPPAVMAASA